MQASALVAEVAVDLNDYAPGHEFTTWSEAQLLTYISEGVQTAAVERPDLFVQTRILKVEPLSLLQDACDCTRVRRVLGQSTASGRVIKQLKLRSTKDNLRWPGKRCPTSPANFELEEYSIDSETDKLWLYPEVPPGLDVYVLIECSVIPDDIDATFDIPTELIAAVKQWVLFRARAVDAELSQAAMQAAGMHETEFWKLVASQKQNNEWEADRDE